MGLVRMELWGGEHFILKHSNPPSRKNERATGKAKWGKKASMLRWRGLSLGVNLSISVAQARWAELTLPGPQAPAERLPLPPSLAPAQVHLPSCELVLC